jgi:flagellar biosynthesis/type III secretory pathway protein FliH
MRDRIWRWIRVAALAATVSLAFGSVAWGQNWGRYDDDNYYNRDHEAREQGFHRGYDDGFRKGQYDAERGHRFKFKNDDWEDSRGYQRWMGDKRGYKDAYRDGYERGYREAYNDYGYRYRDDRYRDRDDWR